jgi:small subunit ribosomal protein S8
LVEQRTENPCVGSSNLSLSRFKYNIMKNYLWNMFANLKNGQLARRAFILQTRKKICESFLKILWDEGFILGYTIDSENSDKIKIFLKYREGKPAINAIKLISKPSRRIYYSTKQIWKIDSSKSFIIFSTNKGLKTVTDCKKLRLGGEPFIVVN